jgi:hypothetical protein
MSHDATWKKIVREQLNKHGFVPVELANAPLPRIRSPLRVFYVCKNMDGRIGVIEVPSGAYIEVYVCVVDDVMLLISEDIAREWLALSI